MPPPIKPRENYTKEMSQLLFIERVVESDSKMPAENKAKVQAYLLAIITLLSKENARGKATPAID